MTREEFIIAYNIGHRDGKNDEYLPCDYPEFIQQEPCKDVESRLTEEAIRIISNQINGDNKIEHESTIDTTNKTLPPDTPAEKMGKWIINPFGMHANLICDNCFASAPYNYRTKYCPNCGLPKDTGGA